MIGRIRRLIGRTQEDAPGEVWDSSVENRSSSEGISQVLVSQTPVEQTLPSEPSSYDPASNSTYHEDVVKAMIEHSGFFGKYHAPVGWLKMTLEGLRGRPMDKEAMWEGSESETLETESDQPEGKPTFQDLFPTRHSSTGFPTE